jgi:voltage-dependent calcium channel alpha-2/delta-3
VRLLSKLFLCLSSDFIKANSRATEELWYKRAVERYETDPDSFVFSVPFDAGTRNDSKVTATRAVYVRKNNLEAPVAVVGVQFRHNEWANKFFEITSTVS